MHSEVEKLVERLRNYRPPVADGYGYPVSEVPREHHPICDEAASLIERLCRERDDLRNHVDDLQQAEAEYRLMHDRHGEGSSAAGRAWDVMKIAGDRGRRALAGEDVQG